jgi:hypothetical protein
MKTFGFTVSALALFPFIVFGCSFDGKPDVSESSGRAISSLADVFADPLSSDGKEFEGYVYIYRGEGFFAFFPRQVLSDLQVGSFDVTVLPNGTSAAVASLGKFKTGERLLIRGKISTDRPCFSTDTCAPWPHPVFIDNLEVIGK